MAESINPLLLVPDSKVSIEMVPSGASLYMPQAPAEVGGSAASGYTIKIYEKLAEKMYADSWLINKGVTYEQLRIALAVHEISHIKYDSFKINTDGMNRLQRWILNLVEDSRIEYHLSHDNPSMATYLRILLATLRTHMDSSSDNGSTTNLVQKLIKRRSVELYYLVRFGLVVEGSNEEFINFCLPLILSSTRGDHHNSVKVTLAITSFIEMQANDLARHLKKLDEKKREKMEKEIEKMEKEQGDFPAESPLEEKETWDDDLEDEGDSGDDDDIDEVPITSSDDKSQDEPGEAVEDTEDDEEEDEDEDTTVKLPPTPEDLLEEELDDEDIDIDDLADYDPAEFARALRSMDEVKEEMTEGQLDDIGEALEDSDAVAMPSNISQIVDKMTSEESEQTGGGAGGAFDENTPMELEEKEHIFYRETVAKHRDLIYRLRNSVKQLFRTTEIRHTFDGDLNPMRQQNAYLNSLIGESGRDYQRMEPGHQELDLVILRDVSGSTSGFSNEYAEAMISILTAMDGMDGVRTAAIDFSNGATELKTFDQKVAEGRIYPRVIGATYISKALRSCLDYEWKAPNRLIIVITDGAIQDLHRPEVVSMFEEVTALKAKASGYHVTRNPNPKRIENSMNDMLPMTETKLEDLPNEVIRMVTKKLKNI